MRKIAWAVALLATATAAAHEDSYPKHDRLTLSGAAIRLELDFAIPAGNDARALKQLFDRNHNKSLDPNEARALSDYMMRQTVNFLAVTVDGQHLAPKLEKVTADPMVSGPDRVAVHVEMSVAVNHPHHIRFGDRLKDGRINIPVEVILDGVELGRPLVPQPFVFAEHPLDLDLK